MTPTTKIKNLVNQQLIFITEPIRLLTRISNVLSDYHVIRATYGDLQSPCSIRKDAICFYNNTFGVGYECFEMTEKDWEEFREYLLTIK
jgi:hypothetical protein